jgi:uncharacterized protein YbjT (DUF2867 family)
MLLLDHEIDLDGVVHTPGLAKVPRKTCATHRESVIENDELVALSALRGDVPAFQGNAVIRLEIDTRELMSPADKRMPMLQGNYRVPHFDAKAEADAYFEGLPVTYLITSFYWDNLYAFGLGPKKEDDGSYSWTFPMGTARLAGIAAEDIGKVALGIFEGGARYIGKRIAIAGEHLTMSEMAEKLSKALGISTIKYNAVEPDAYRSFGFPGADEMGNMFQVYRDFEKEVVGIRSVPSTRELNPQLLNFDAWLAKYGNRIAI